MYLSRKVSDLLILKGLIPQTGAFTIFDLLIPENAKSLFGEKPRMVPYDVYYVHHEFGWDWKFSVRTAPQWEEVCHRLLSMYHAYCQGRYTDQEVEDNILKQCAINYARDDMVSAPKQ